MVAAKKLFLLLWRKKVIQKVIIIVLCIIFLYLIIFISIMMIMQIQTENTGNSALAEAASAEYSYWERTTPEAAGYACQGEKYCSHFDVGLTDWCCYFVGTCADNAGINPDDIGFSPATNTWRQNLISMDKLKSAGSYSPQRGNLVFFNYDGRSNYAATGFVAHIGIVTETYENTITVIAGNEYNGATENWANVSYVNKYTLNIDDDSIACYGAVGADSTVSANELNQVTRDIICHNEIGVLYSEINTEYGSVIANDNGALSIGVYGWHGNKALALLQKAYKINNVQVTNITRSFSSSGISVLGAIQGSEDWSSYIPDVTTCACIKAILLTDTGKQAQDETSLEDAQNYIDICNENGLTDNKVIAYCSDILNQYGTASFNANVYGAGSNGVLYGVNNSMTLDTVYKSQRAWSDSNYSYESRRTWTYEYLKNL